ncbi:hypothetical protein K466DRAFT_199908 [Polyporus arcularius HHB13444]|uniref:DUF7704 domain-containing protein n=1 Tax=Polyporus arcularius HHB13444 TaxID=1314778 RepID=A0A5C3P8B9_9APHY|nr:hypothetical protein K466DRAFT_199908 [Polyporus arcularius HHB13444]
MSPTNIPLAYRLFFLYIEPVSAIVGAFYAGWQPAQYLAYLTTSATPAADPDTSTTIALQQLANLYVLFAINEHFVLSSTASLRTWRALLAGLLVADFGHLLTMVPMARERGYGEVFGRFWAWDAMLWGSVGFVYVGASMRTAFLLGVGLGKSGSERGGKGLGKSD